MRCVCLLSFLTLSSVCLQSVDAATFTVTTLNDNSDASAGNGVCADAGAACSFRAALEEANALAGSDTVEFNISGTGPHSAEPNSPFPVITGAIVIDGTTEPDWVSGTPVIVLNGSSAGSAAGLEISAGNSTVRGLIINGFSDEVIHLHTNGGNTIEGCWLGTDDEGLSDADQTVGLLIDDIPNNTVGGTTAATRNVIAGISGNGDGHGVEISGSSATDNVIQGNYIGVDMNGTSDLANSHHGVFISGADDNTIGGTASGAGNVISGNSSAGIYIQDGADGTVIQGNYIGTNAAGDDSVPNGDEGINLQSTTNTTIGGSSAAARNIISGNGAHGIYGSENDGTIVQGNFIGTDVNGTASTANEGDAGVEFNSDSQNLTIGGTASGAGNRSRPTVVMASSSMETPVAARSRVTTSART